MTLLNATQEHYWRDRYALRDAQNEVVERTIEDTFHRVADAIGDSPSEREDFYSILQDFHFVPAGRILSGAGAQSEKTFYNCYVIPLETKARRNLRDIDAWYEQWGEAENEHEQYAIRRSANTDHGSDSREAIFDTINTMVGIMSRGGGVGINWSVLRPETSHLVRVSGSSSGPVGWMDVASTAVGEVIQGGSRRGAAMFMLDIWHPDVMRFINEKRDNTKITNANVSVGVTDRFMEALSRDEDWTFEFPDTTHPEYDSSWDGDIEAWRARGLPLVAWGTEPARRVWEAISEAAWSSGEPGVIFLDRYNALSTANGEERIICVNPCGEQGLGAYSVCNLGAMNLYAYITHKDDVDNLLPVPWFNFQRFSTDVKTAIRFLDNVIDKTPDYLPETTARQQRLRRVGLGVMGLADALVALGIRYGSPDSVKFVEDVFRCMKDAAIESSSLLASEKGSALGWNAKMFERPFLKEYLERHPESLPASQSENVGIRNIFLLTQAPTGTTSLLADVNSGIEPYFNKNITWREDRTGGRFIGPRAIADIWGVSVRPDGIDYIVDSSEVTVDEHIAIQAAVQKYVDSSVSKTINAPKEQTVAETARAFTRAYYEGLKGIAYYRDGSRDQQVLYHQNPNDRIRELEEQVAKLQADKDYWISKSNLHDNPLEIPVGSLAFYGAQKVLGQEEIDAQFRANGTYAKPYLGVSYLRDGWVDNGKCPSCDGNLAREEGCKKCYGCGWSAC